MNSQDRFINCESISYGLYVREPQITVSEIEDIKDLQFTSKLGYSVVLNKGKVTFHGSDDQAAQLIKNEIEDNLIDQYPSLSDFIRFVYWNNEVLVSDIKNVINEVQLMNPFDITFVDVIEYIIQNWKLNARQKRALALQLAEDAIEYTERSYK